MGRELKRVPLDFDWPLKETWKGYKNNEYSGTKCLECDGNGYSKYGRFFQDQWYGRSDKFDDFPIFNPLSTGSQDFEPDNPAIVEQIKHKIARSPEYYTGPNAIQNEAERMCDIWNQSWSHHLSQEDVQALLDDDRLYDFTHDWSKETGWVKKNPPYIPTAAEVNLWSLFGLGHDSSNSWTCIKARCKKLGVDYLCNVCKGEGRVWASEEARLKDENWQRTDPPTGEGFQLWDTTGDGSPVSPVFKDLDSLCAWAETNATTFGSNKATAAEWKQMLDDGLVYHQEGNFVFI